MKRRAFLKSSLAGAAMIAVPGFVSGQQTTDNRLQTMEYGEGSVDSCPLSVVRCPFDAPVLGMAGYTFNKFDIDTTLAFMKRIDVHYLCIKDFHLPLDADAAQIAAFKAKLAAHDVVGYGVGPIYMMWRQWTGLLPMPSVLVWTWWWVCLVCGATRRLAMMCWTEWSRR